MAGGDGYLRFYRGLWLGGLVVSAPFAKLCIFESTQILALLPKRAVLAQQVERALVADGLTYSP